MNNFNEMPLNKPFWDKMLTMERIAHLVYDFANNIKSTTANISQFQYLTKFI